MMKFILITFFFQIFLGASTYAVVTAKTCRPQKLPIKFITDLKKIYADKNWNLCESLNVGESRVYQVYREKSPTNVEHSYQMKRTSKNEYLATFDFNFYDKDDPDDSSRNRGYTYVWRKKANECLKAIGNGITGPNGEILKLQVNENPKQRRGEPSEIILMQGERANSHAWEKSMDCPTIVHEMLHLMGLVDEYKEKQSGYALDPNSGRMVWRKRDAEKPGYDCRALSKETSIMANQEEHWNKVFGKATLNRKIQICECNESKLCEKYFQRNDETFQKYGHYLTQWKENEKNGIQDLVLDKQVDEIQSKMNAEINGKLPNACPDGFKVNDDLTEDFQIEESQKDFSYFRSKPFPEYMTEQRLLNIVTIANLTPLKKENISLVNETQWNAIMFPGCYAKNWKYYLDAQNAYRTSEKNGGKGCYKYYFLPEEEAKPEH